MSRIVTFGEIMMKLIAPGQERFTQAAHFEVHNNGS